MPWPTLVRKWFVVSVGKPFSERPWRSSYPHLHLLCICLYAHHYHYFSCSLFILKFTSCGQEHNFICHHIPIPHSSSTYCSSKIHLEIYLDTQAGEKYWHEHHFICCDCGVRIRGDSKVRKILFFLGHFYYTLGNFGKLWVKLSPSLYLCHLHLSRFGRRRVDCTATQITRRSSFQDAPTAVDSYLGS